MQWMAIVSWVVLLIGCGDENCHTFSQPTFKHRSLNPSKYLRDSPHQSSLCLWHQINTRQSIIRGDRYLVSQSTSVLGSEDTTNHKQHTITTHPTQKRTPKATLHGVVIHNDHHNHGSTSSPSSTSQESSSSSKD